MIFDDIPLTDAQTKTVKIVRRLMDRFEIETYAEDRDIAWVIHEILLDARKGSEARLRLRHHHEDMRRFADGVFTIESKMRENQ